MRLSFGKNRCSDLEPCGRADCLPAISDDSAGVASGTLDNEHRRTSLNAGDAKKRVIGLSLVCFAVGGQYFH
jgi:hypothetical protein